MRRRRLIFRSIALALALGCGVALTVAALAGPEVSIALVLLAVVLFVLAVIEAARLVAAIRGTDPDVHPPGRWWLCELPVDHRLVRVAGPQESDPTWHCTRCGHVQHEPPSRSIGESVGNARQGFPHSGQQTYGWDDRTASLFK